MIKVCVNCNIEKDTKFFGKDKTRKDGFFPYCKTCKRAKEKIWRDNHKEKRAETWKNWKENNPSAKEVIKNSYDKWIRKNRKKENVRLNIVNHKRRSIYKQTDITIDWLMQLKEDTKICPICGIKLTSETNKYDASHYNLDHVVPISKGGAHVKNNVRYICRKCNQVKSNGIYIKT